MTPSSARRLILRPITARDTGTLFGLYRQTRAAELLLLPWSDAQKEQFARQQYDAQRADYEARFPTAEHSIVEELGEPVGRIWIDRRADEIRLLDIIVDDRRQGRGIGSALLGDLIAEASAAGVALRHSVLATNDAAMRFYRRLGFDVIEDFDMYVLMEWLPPDEVNRCG